jgi:ABC-type lipoprotein release transport system permease subunit
MKKNFDKTYWSPVCGKAGLFERMFLVVSVGYFLATRQIKRTSRWTTILIIFIMTLTFLNLVVVSGILIGLVEGSSRANRSQYSGDLLIKALPTKIYIEKGVAIKNTLANYYDVKAVSARYLEPVRIEGDLANRSAKSIKSDETSAILTGIDPAKEDALTDLSRLIVEGRYFNQDDTGGIILGSALIGRFSSAIAESDTLKNIKIGDDVLVKKGDKSIRLKVIGIIKSKIGEVSLRAFVQEKTLRQLTQRPLNNYDEIAVKVNPGIDAHQIKDALIKSGYDNNALIQTWEESQGAFLKDIGSTFDILANFIGSIALAASSITVFIVIFINAFNRKRFIGIMKAIGISSWSIQLSYIIQSTFYGLVASLIGVAVLYGLIKPYFDANPIDFPFSDGVLVADIGGTVMRIGLLIISIIIAGYLPARIIVRKNTLDSILGRN